MKNKFTWGDSVIVRTGAPLIFHPGEYASICGMYQSEEIETANFFQCHQGEWIYTIEFGDGSSIEVAELYLEPLKI